MPLRSTQLISPFGPAVDAAGPISDSYVIGP
jgi:hypothetical protein